MSDNAIEDPMDGEYSPVNEVAGGGALSVEGAMHDDEGNYLEDREMTPVPEDAIQDNNRNETERPAENYQPEYHEGEETPWTHDYKPAEGAPPFRNDEDFGLIVSTSAIEIETLLANYSGIPLKKRLEFVIDHCPPLRREATIALINYLRSSTKDVQAYSKFHSQLETLQKPTTCQIPTPTYDKKWVDDQTVNNSTRQEHLLCEYKKQKEEGVKESTRRAMEELFQYYLNTGNAPEASRLYGRGIRDYCNQFKHTIQMWVNWIEVSLAIPEWSKVDSLIQQSLRTLRDSEEAEKAGNNRASRPMQERGHQTTSGINKQLVEIATAKITAAQALVRINQGNYKMAAAKILELTGVDHLSSSQWFVSVADLGAYATMCCLATYSRSELKQKVVNEGAFRKLLESEPLFVEMLQAFIKSNFGRCLDILAAVVDKLSLDPFLSRHVPELVKLIRERAVLQYLAPFETVRLRPMSETLRCTQKELEEILIDIVERKKMNLKIDRIGDMVRVTSSEAEESSYRRVIQVCDELVNKARAVLYRAIMTKENVVVLHDKESRGKRKTHFAEGNRGANANNTEKTTKPKGTARPNAAAAKVPTQPDPSREPNEPQVPLEHVAEPVSEIRQELQPKLNMGNMTSIVATPSCSMHTPGSPRRSIRSLDSSGNRSSTTPRSNTLRSSSSSLEERLISVKSKFGADYRRFCISIGGGRSLPTFEDFQKSLHDVHKLTENQRTTTLLTYVSLDGTVLPLNNNENFRKAMLDGATSRQLRVAIGNKGESQEEEFGYGVVGHRLSSRRKKVSISAPQEFRTVSSILDVDTLPGELRRVRLCKFYNNKPLGFFIRDGPSYQRPAGWSPSASRGIFISRLLPHGLAASTNLLHVDDEILEVNGIDVSGKTLDQVTDVMIANSANLILTVRIARSWTPPTFVPYPVMPPPYGFQGSAGYYPPPPAIFCPLPSYLPSSFQSPTRFCRNYPSFIEPCHMEEPGPLYWPMNFSRESTWRLSSEGKRTSSKSTTPASTTRTQPRRPFSVHEPFNFAYPQSPSLPSFYGH
ncbi:unnamed protein product [Caenorhabditis auriculariae]|uniref:Uncharacterized protein n=1 Tax=Caenorhabditis auriculariae TaxID=2777116 RepID=A0A8S1HG04_9PELO|nr:unnamed protein product [Caenorhabditis auriculariae]